jgi:hypothetical protein
LKDYLQHKKHDVNLRDKCHRWPKLKSLWEQGCMEGRLGPRGPPTRNKTCLGSLTVVVTLNFPEQRVCHWLKGNISTCDFLFNFLWMLPWVFEGLSSPPLFHPKLPRP